MARSRRRRATTTWQQICHGLCHVRGFYLSIGRGALSPHVYLSTAWGIVAERNRRENHPIVRECDNAAAAHNYERQDREGRDPNPVGVRAKPICAKRSTPFFIFFARATASLARTLVGGQRIDAAVAKVPSPRIEIVKRSDDMKGFVLLPRSWVVERTFSWFGHNRRLAKDWENLAAMLQAFVALASI